MATTTIRITAAAHKLLKQLKEPGESFSDVIIDHFRQRRSACETAGEMLDRLESLPAPMIDEKKLKALRMGRARRSKE
jgi:predicted CopG family antitoxin